MTSLVKAAKADAKVRVLVTTEMVRQMKAQAPTGKGPRMRPAMVVRKMAKSCHAFSESCEGFGMAKQRMTPTEMEIASGIGFAPCQLRKLKEERCAGVESVGMAMTVVVLGGSGGGGFDMIMAVVVAEDEEEEEDW